MVSVYPASPAHRRLLRSAPGLSDCLVCRGAESLRGLADMIVFLWMRDGTGQWYRIRSVGADTLSGYALRGGRWLYRPVELRRIARYF